MNLAGGDDTLDGGAGADTMEGRAGNDTYVVDNLGDWVIEAANEGTDTVQTTLNSYELGADVERLTFMGRGDFTGSGNALVNVITDGIGSDVLNGLDGNDVLLGRAGHDAMRGGNHNDHLEGEKGDDRLYGDAGADTLYGGDGQDVLEGGSGSDNLDGGTGHDRMRGWSGNDELRAGGGNDALEGGTGADVLFGGSGEDAFRFLTTDDSPTAAGTRDGIWDFQAGIDKIDVSAIDARQLLDVPGNQAFVFLGAPPATAFAGDLWLQGDGNSTWVHAEVNGDGVADFSVLVVGVTGLAASDVIL